MNTIDVKLSHHQYPIYIGANTLSGFADVLEKHYPARQIFIISSKNIDRFYGESLRSGFSKDKIIHTKYVPDGEIAKSYQQLERLHTEMLKRKYERGSLVIALGGGVVGDLAGFVAATFLRGIEFVQVPTTLLAQVDSSIGGKVGINHRLGKNLVGAFKQPQFVFSDTRVLKTLPAEELRCGLGEVIKYGFILDKNLFEYVEQNLDALLAFDEKALRHVVTVSSELKADIVERDEKESQLRMVLNYGHTFGHALEALFEYGQIKHGEAVILGIKCALHYSHLQKRIDRQDYQRGIKLLDRIPIEYDKKILDPDALVAKMKLDKKVKDSQVRLVLSDRIGSYAFHSAQNDDELKKAFEILK